MLRDTESFGTKGIRKGPSRPFLYSYEWLRPVWARHDCMDAGGRATHGAVAEGSAPPGGRNSFENRLLLRTISRLQRLGFRPISRRRQVDGCLTTGGYSRDLGERGVYATYTLGVAHVRTLVSALRHLKPNSSDSARVRNHYGESAQQARLNEPQAEVELPQCTDPSILENEAKTDLRF